MYIVSKCLLGHNCKYNGENNYNSEVEDFCKNHSCVLVCPETEGGLKSPRPPAERNGERIIDSDGNDVTAQFIAGAKRSLERCLTASEEAGETLDGAILKAKSPSCGAGRIYDGSFSGTLIDGDGVFAAMLRERKIDIITEKEKIQW